MSKPTDVEGSLHASFGTSNGSVDAVKSRKNCDSSNSEDGWVEVKVPDSLPIDGDDSIRPGTRVEGLAGNSLMLVLVPPLLQLSKTRISQMQDKYDVNKTERRMCEDVGPKLSGSAMTSTEVQFERVSDAADPQKLVLEKVNSSSFQLPESGAETQALHGGDKHKLDSTSGIGKFSTGHIGRTLDHRVFRLTRIEDFCLRFEENIMKPITSMEARLERVEQQLELLTENSCCS